MKSIICLCFALISFFSISHAQTVTVIHKNDTYKALEDNTVIMNIQTYAKYDYSVKQLDTVKSEVKHLDSLLEKQDKVQSELTKTYESALSVKQQEINSYQSSYEQLKLNTNTCIEKQNQLQVDYLKLQQKNKRIKTWRNWFMGTSLCFGTVIVLLATH